ncbi:hypothetical protein J6590_014380 [Homalodisca vitripennis]|nr:hypothetical protein J6590_014380 [Homalodisca vitripennis]
MSTSDVCDRLMIIRDVHVHDTIIDVASEFMFKETSGGGETALHCCSWVFGCAMNMAETGSAAGLASQIGTVMPDLLVTSVWPRREVAALVSGPASDFGHSLLLPGRHEILA